VAKQSATRKYSGSCSEVFRIEFTKRALKSLRSFQPQVRQRVLEKIGELPSDPFPHGVLKVHGEQNVYRLRVGDYRILYEVYKNGEVILIVKVEHRSTVYER
jgi:mRNA interferase RelE/StbE